MPDDSRFLDQQYAVLGPDHDYTSQFAKTKELATSGDRDAQFNLGVAYVRGIGTAKDAKEGVKWLRFSAERGQPRAGQYLAFLYLSGTGSDIPREDATAYFWLIVSHAAGHENYNQEVLKTILPASKAQEVEHAATDWLRQHSDVPAYAYQLGLDYSNGVGVPKDLSESLRWLGKAAADGHTHARLLMGIYYLRGDNGLTADRAESLKWLRLAALQGDSKSQLLLGKMCAEDSQPGHNLEAAKSWLALALKSGDPYILSSVAGFFLSPDPALRDLNQAVALAERAVALSFEENPDYLNTLAMAYFESGEFEEAFKVERKCVALNPGDPELLNRLAWWELTVTDQKLRDPGQALELAKSAVNINQNEPAFLDTLAEAYFANGDPGKAVEWERKALTLKPGNPKPFEENLEKYSHADQQKAKQ